MIRLKKAKDEVFFEQDTYSNPLSMKNKEIMQMNISRYLILFYNNHIKNSSQKSFVSHKMSTFHQIKRPSTKNDMVCLEGEHILHNYVLTRGETVII